MDFKEAFEPSYDAEARRVTKEVIEATGVVPCIEPMTADCTKDGTSFLASENTKKVKRCKNRGNTIFYKTG